MEIFRSEGTLRSNNVIKRKYYTIFSFLGLVCIFTGFLLLTPLIALFFNFTGNIYAFLKPSILSFIIGTVLLLLFRRKNNPVNLTLQDGAVVVILSWVYVCLISSIPFLLENHLNFTNALFESVSGWTTTGLTVIDVSKSSKVILLWRSILQFCGGAGFAVLMLSTIIGPYGAGLYQAEGRSEQLLPHIKSSAKMVMFIYSFFTVLGILAYRFAGMSFFNSINHSFCALSTGGFTTVSNSIGHWKSLPIEIVTIVLMILGSTNFAISYLLLKMKFKKIFHNVEWRVTLLLTIITISLITFLTIRPFSFDSSLRESIFQVVTALTTTGYSTVSLSGWPNPGIFIIVLLMLVGGGICSTAGGIKQYRIYLLMKSIFWDIRDHFLPRSSVVKDYIWRGEDKFYIGNQHMRQVYNFVFLYVFTFFIGVLIFLITGYSFKDSFFEFASALGTVGLSVGVTGPEAPKHILWTEIFGMFLGRLEFLVVLFGIRKLFLDFKTFVSLKNKF